MIDRLLRRAGLPAQEHRSPPAQLSVPQEFLSLGEILAQIPRFWRRFTVDASCIADITSSRSFLLSPLLSD